MTKKIEVEKKQKQSTTLMRQYKRWRNRVTQARRDPKQANPPGDNRDLGAGQGQQWGENRRVNDSRHRNTVQGAETSGRIWMVVGVGAVHVNVAPR